MKACLMRVNYDPRYTTPHHNSTLQSRLAVTRDIYGSGTGFNVQKTLKETLEEAAARKKARQRLLQTLGTKTPDKEKDVDNPVSPHGRNRPRKVESNSPLPFLRINETLDEAIDNVPDSLMLPLSKGWCEEEPSRHRKKEERADEGHRRNRSRHDQHKEGVAAAHSSLRPSHQSSMKSTSPPGDKGSTPITAPTHFYSHRQFSSYGERLLKRQQSINALTVQARNRYSSPCKQIGASHDTALSYYNRSRTLASFGDILSKKSAAKIELEKRAKREAEKAIKDRKVFTIMGPYHSLRQALRRRGWVERFNNAPPPGEISIRRRPVVNISDSDDDDGNDRHHKENITPPWEEENGFYGMMSYLTRNCTPSLIFAVKTVDVEARKGGQLVNHFGKARHFTTKSQAVQKVRPTLIFAVRSLDVESRSRHQIVNHYAKANNFTTKLGLCQNLREVPWYEKADPDEFYPRCYKLEDEEEKQAFIDDFHLTAAVSFIKWFVEKYDGITVGDEEENKKTLNSIVTSMMSTTQALGNETVESVTGTTPHSQQTLEEQSGSRVNIVQPNSRSTSAIEANDSPNGNKLLHVASDPKHDSLEKEKALPAKRTSSLPPVLPPRGLSAVSHSISTTSNTITAANSSPPASPTGSVMGRFLYHRSGKTMKAKYYHVAVRQCENYIKTKEHEDIDEDSSSDDLNDAQWDQFLTWYYTFVHEDADFMKVTGAMVRHCKSLLEKIKLYCPQFTLDGYRNVWIVKPGAKSRGRGIQCDDRLDKILAMCDDNEDKLVAQKYIERPFLVYDTKFDIRQWFLVTDWQPLTIWFYKSCYLRFCTQNFTLENFHESIHLSNNSVQKNYTNNTERSDKLPSDNMWTNDEFDEFLKKNGHGDVWKEAVVPGMKSALTCALLCTQELVEVRKSAFELYGADFMLTDDLQPWLIEINSSPSMARNTRATCKLVDDVLEDTLKVVLDRRRDKNADTGEFECILRQNYICDPRPPDTDLAVAGRKIRKKHFSYTPHKGPVQR